MADAYWRYGDGWQQPPAAIPTQVAKRPRPDFEMPTGPDMSSFYVHKDNTAGHRVIKDTDTINASYVRYLRTAQQISSFGVESGRSISSGLPHDDPRVMTMAGSNTVMAAKSGLPMAVGGQRENRLPPDASCTLYVECLPANCTRREVAHIFLPFVGYNLGVIHCCSVLSTFRVQLMQQQQWMLYKFYVRNLPCRVSLCA